MIIQVQNTGDQLETSLQERVRQDKKKIDDNKIEFDLQVAKNINPDSQYWVKYLQDSDYATGLKQAYDNPAGYAIRQNPSTGNWEMIIAGTHNPMKKGERWKGVHEWLQNAVETVGGVGDLAWKAAKLEAKLDLDIEEFLAPETASYAETAKKYLDDIPQPSDIASAIDGRDAFTTKLEQIAAEHDPPVTVIVGHSRGAAIASGFDGSKYQIIGLDGATFEGHKSNMINVHSTSLFDKTLGLGHGKSKTVTLKGTEFHNVTQRKAPKSKKVKADTAQKKNRGGSQETSIFTNEEKRKDVE
jgi:hypothetical protein